MANKQKGIVVPGRPVGECDNGLASWKPARQNKNTRLRLFIEHDIIICRQKEKAEEYS